MRDRGRTTRVLERRAVVLPALVGVLTLGSLAACSSDDDSCAPESTPATAAAQDDGPDRVSMRQGVPSNVEIDREEYRFGIRGVAGSCRVTFTVLHDGEETSHTAEPAAEVEAAGVEWVVTELSDDPARIVLHRAP